MFDSKYRLEQAKQNLEKRLENLEVWDHAVWAHPGDQQAAEQAAHGRLMVEQAREQLKQAEEAAAIAANPTTPQAIKELKRLDQVNKEGLAMTKSITNEVEALAKEIEKWHKLQDESKRIASRYDMRPFDLGIAGSRLGTLQNSIKSWLQEVHTWDRWAELNK